MVEVKSGRINEKDRKTERAHDIYWTKWYWNIYRESMNNNVTLGTFNTDVTTEI